MLHVETHVVGVCDMIGDCKPQDILYHIYSMYLGHFVVCVPFWADHILSAWPDDAMQLTFNKHLYECKVAINYLRASDTDVQSVR